MQYTPGANGTQPSARSHQRSVQGSLRPRKLTDLCDISGIVSPPVDRRLADEGKTANARVTEDVPESRLPDGPKPNMLVPVKPAPELALAVVDVDDAETG